LLSPSVEKALFQEKATGDRPNLFMKNRKTKRFNKKNVRKKEEQEQCIG
jgi:hypothetical protein